LTCGQGDGAARVIDKTMSPSKRLALAWRSMDHPPTEPAEDYDDLELLLIRLKDGAVLSRRMTYLGHRRDACEPPLRNCYLVAGQPMDDQYN
jgi:hypothetical protein